MLSVLRKYAKIDTLFLLFFGAIYYGDEVLVRKWIKQNFVYLMRRAMQQSCFHLKIIHCSIIVLHFGGVARRYRQSFAETMLLNVNAPVNR